MTGKGLFTLVVDGMIPPDEIENKRKQLSTLDTLDNICSWENHDKHMTELSKMYPGNLFGLVCLPEFSNSPWVKIYQGGQLVSESKGDVSVNIKWLHDPEKVGDDEYLMIQKTVSNYQLCNRLAAAYTNSNEIPPMKNSSLLKDNLNPHNTTVGHDIDEDKEEITILSPMDGGHITFGNLNKKQAETLKVLNQKYIVLKNEAQS